MFRREFTSKKVQKRKKRLVNCEIGDNSMRNTSFVILLLD